MTYKIIQGDCIEGMRQIADESVHCVVTSPPYYGLRDYGVDGQIGLEETPEAYVEKMIDVFREVRRILRSDGTVWLNLGDSYASGKQLIGIPWRVAFALQADGWWLRQDIIWHKPNPMPESVTDRCTKSHEYIFLLTKSERYFYDAEAVKEKAVSKIVAGGSLYNDTGREAAAGRVRWECERTDYTVTGRNKRSVWTVATQPYAEAHFAVYPPKLIEPCILAGSPVGGVVFDPFTGSGTTAYVALTNGRSYIGTELNPAYIEIAERRLSAIQPRMELS